MLVRESQLKRYIAEELEKSADRKLALFFERGSNDVRIYIYDKAKFTKLFKAFVKEKETVGHFGNYELRETKKIAAKCGVAWLYLLKPRLAPCNGAWQVMNSAGDGKLAYESGYKLVQGSLFPDRFSVSEPARSGWKRQRNKGRPSKPFDDIENPQTDDPNDDCIVYGKSDKDWDVLDRSYDMMSSDAPDVSSMRTAHQSVNKLLLKYFKNEGLVNIIFVEAGQSFFNVKYNE